jgi:hypothetical protein
MRVVTLQVVVCSLVLTATSAEAVPAFARQTGMSCAQCHTVFPELTPFGRQFKANGYVLSTTKQVSEGGDEGKRTVLEFPANVPLGLMAITGYTHTSKDQQVAASGPPAKNDDISFPQQLSLFYAGKIAPKLGAFIQLTYEGPTDHLGLDNTEIRFAHSIDVAGKPLVLGATLNNNPSVSDLWNSTPAWGVPFTASGSAPSPSAATLIEGGLAQGVVGGGAFAYYNGIVDVYAEVDAYRSSPLGVSLPLDASTGATGVVDGFMPYWRLAVEKAYGNSTLMVGTFGLNGALLPGGGGPLLKPGNHFTDVAADAQYQYIGEKHILTATLTYIHENQSLDATHPAGGSDNASLELHSFKGSVSYIYNRLIGARATFQSMRGTGDATFYGGQGPRSTAFTGEIFHTPWYNTRLGLQYTSYLDFNGASTNYDGAGRNASDNNTLYAYLWLSF